MLFAYECNQTRTSGSGFAMGELRLALHALSKCRSLLCRVLTTTSLGLMLVGPSHAAEYGRTVTVTGTLSMAAARPAFPSGQDHVLVYVNSSAWGVSTCRQDAVIIKKADTHLLAQLLTALQTGKVVTLHVDDTLRPIDTAVCQVTMLQVTES